MNLSQTANALAKRICATCGRAFTWRKKWEKNWASIIYCSDTCRKHKIRPGTLDTIFESVILSLLRRRQKTRGPAPTITCEEVEAHVLNEAQPQDDAKARRKRADAIPAAFGPSSNDQPTAQPANTRERCRQAARRLAARGELVITQRGKVVDPSSAKGVMEMKLPTT